MTADINEDYNFPLHIIPTELRPDIVWWDDDMKSLNLIELTVCYETNFDEAAKRKDERYQDLLNDVSSMGYTTSLITLEMGSRGLPHLPGFYRLRDMMGMSRRKFKELMAATTRQALLGSHQVWVNRNRYTP